MNDVPTLECVVPNDCWVCHECSTMYLVQLAPDRCANPYCGHYRCQQCTGPGEPYYGGPITPAPAATQYGQTMYRNSSQRQTYQQYQPQSHQHHSPGYTCPDTPADAWYCPACRAANSGLTPDFCPACGWRPGQ